MLRRLYRQRRRFLFIAALVSFWLTAGLFLGEMPNDMTFPTDSWITWVSFVLTGLVVAAATTLIGTFLLPSMRFAAELMFLTSMSVMLVQTALPDSSLQTGWIQVTLFVAIFVALERLLYHTPLDRWTIRPVAARQRSFHLPVTAQAAWNAFAPLPHLAKTHFYPGTRITPVAGLDDAYDLTFPLKGGQAWLSETIFVEECAPPHRITFRFTPPTDAPGNDGLSGAARIEITPEADGCRVTVAEMRDPAPLRRRLQWWFDDEFMDRTDSMLARAAGRRDWSFLSGQFVKI